MVASFGLTLYNQTYDPGSQLPLLDDLWDITFSSGPTLEGQCYPTAGDLGVVKQQVGQTFDPYPNSVSQTSSRPSINAVSQYLNLTFDPSHTLVSYLTPRIGERVDYQQTDVSGGLPYGISSSGAHHLTNEPTHGYNQPNSIPVVHNLPYGYEGHPREYQYPLDEADTSAGIPLDPLKGPDVINHAR